MANKIAVVFGASGFVGRHVVRELASRGWRVRAAVRKPSAANYLKPLGKVGQIEIVQANIRYRPSINMALSGANAVVNLVGTFDTFGQNDMEELHAAGARNIAEMATKAGIEQIVHISAIGANPRGDAEYARTKAQGEEAFREYAPSAVILRPSVIFGPQDELFNRFGAMAQIAPALPLIGGGKTRFQPVYVDDVADAVAEALENPEHRGRVFELGGPEIVTFKEMMELLLAMIGRKRLLLPLPFAMAGIMGSVGGVVSRLPFIEAPITTDQVKMLKTDNIVGLTNEPVGTLEDLGIQPETMESILPTYLYKFRKQGQFSPETVI